MLKSTSPISLYSSDVDFLINLIELKKNKGFHYFSTGIVVFCCLTSKENDWIQRHLQYRDFDIYLKKFLEFIHEIIFTISTYHIISVAYHMIYYHWLLQKLTTMASFMENLCRIILKFATTLTQNASGW
jgi:hypothetical protein